jgi:hypothetical protein
VSIGLEIFDQGVNFAAEVMAANGSFCRARAAAYGCPSMTTRMATRQIESPKDEGRHVDDEEQKGEKAEKDG